MIEHGEGDILRARVDALVNAVNTVGVMGKGLALQFKEAFPDNFRAYEGACARGEVVVGRMFVVARQAPPRFIINFPTKAHWRQPSKLEYIAAGRFRALIFHPANDGTPQSTRCRQASASGAEVPQGRSPGGVGRARRWR